MAMTAESIAEYVAERLVELDTIAIATTADVPPGEILLLTQGGQPFKLTVTAGRGLDEEAPAEEPDEGTETEPEEAEEPA